MLNTIGSCVISDIDVN
jgi:cytochrome c biogenesis factor